MASAFISYAHEDQEFMLALVEPLRAEGLDVRYDQVVLNIGDSLIQKIAGEIVEGDFLIAIVSPDSVESAWCQQELSLAATQGINERRVKVLPVKFRGAAMPPLLTGTFWADADAESVETVARRLAASMRANMEGREAEADQEAADAEGAGGAAAHAEFPGDVVVEQLDAVSERVWDVFTAWEGMWAGGNVRDIRDTQRRLRGTLDRLSDAVRAALPLIEQFATADWDGYFGVTEVADAERDIREEMHATRTRVAQGLPVVRRWLVINDLGQVSAGNRDAVAYLWGLQRGDESRRIVVYISGTAMASSDSGLPSEVVAAKATRGRSVLSMLVGLDDPPTEVMATTAGISLTLPD